jgi:hypothetical protein
MDNEEFDLGLIACGPWLSYSLWKKILVALWHWPRIVVKTTFKWLVYYNDNDFVSAKKYWNSIAAFECLDYKWLWYSSRESLHRLREEGNPPTYPVDWEEKGCGWYPLW